MKTYILLLLITSSSFVKAQNPQLDSLRDLHNEVEGTEKIDLLNTWMEAHVCHDDSTAMLLYREGMSLLEGIDYPYGKIIAYKHYGTMMYCQGKLDSIRYYQRRGALLADRHGFHSLAGRLFSNVGFLYNISANYDSSKYYFDAALDQSIVAEDSLLMSIVYSGLGIITQQRGLLNTSLQMYLKGLTIAESSQDTLAEITARLNLLSFYNDYRKDLLKRDEVEEVLMLARIKSSKKQEVNALEHLGYMMAYEGEYDTSIATFEEGLLLNQSLKDITREILLNQGLSFTYHLSGNYHLSLEYIDKAIELSKSSGFLEYLPALYEAGVKNLIKLDRFELAISYGQEGIAKGKESEKIEFYYQIYQDLAFAYEALGMSSKAYQAQFDYSRLSEELLGIKKSQQLADMQAKYEAEKREAEITLLSQQASIQTLEIKQKNQVIIIGLGVISFILVAFYFIYKQREIKKQQTQTALEQRFLRSQLNPHFISNALVAVQSFMLKNDAESAAHYLTKFSKLMREILENSRKEFILVEEEISMLKNYLDIHKLRLGSFDYSIELDQSIDPEMDRIPPMFVQPFVENAVEHGIAELENGKIELKFKKDGDYISIAVNDNGKGYSPIPNASHTSLSTTIIKERMELFNKSLKRKIEMVLGDLTSEGGTSVQLRVPFE